ncbi:unnamed protein product, partial [Heterotrigona itama]
FHLERGPPTCSRDFLDTRYLGHATGHLTGFQNPRDSFSTRAARFSWLVVKKRGAKLHLWSSFSNACMFTFRTPPAIRCWNVRPLVGATQYPPSPFPLLPVISVAS